MINFYKYLIYRLYTWRLAKKDDTPATTVVLLMCIPHYLQLGTIYACLMYFFPVLRDLSDLSKWQVLFIALGFQLLYRLIIYNKNRWTSYINEFENETPEQRKRRTLFIYIYTIGSILLFFISLPVLFYKG